MGVKKTYIRTMLYQAGRSRSRMSFLMLPEEQMKEVDAMLMEANEAVSNIMSKRKNLSASQLISFSCVMSAAILKLVKDVWGDDALSIYERILEDQWGSIKDKDMNVFAT